MAKVLISIDDELLRDIDQAAGNSGLSRSAYIGKLARQELSRAEEEALVVSRQALERLAALGRKIAASDGSVTDWIRMDRDSH